MLGDRDEFHTVALQLFQEHEEVARGTGQAIQRVGDNGGHVGPVELAFQIPPRRAVRFCTSRTVALGVLVHLRRPAARCAVCDTGGALAFGGQFVARGANDGLADVDQGDGAGHVSSSA